MPLFSIVIPVYNVAPYLRECLDSVLSQNFQDYEVCIVDDGSSDGSEVICDEYKQRYSHLIKLLHQPNQGVSVARNRALDIAMGEYIWFVDADDYILPGALAYLNNIVRASGSDTVFFGNKKYNGEQAVLYECSERDSFLRTHICYSNPLMLFNRYIIQNQDLRFTKGMKMGEDLEFQYKYLLHCIKPVAIEYNFYSIRVRVGSASRSNTSIVVNLESSNVLLSNMLACLQKLKEKDYLWIQGRISERLKSYLQSAAYARGVDWQEIQRRFNFFIKSYKNLGLENIAVGSLKLACINVKLYSFLYRVVMKIKL